MGQETTMSDLSQPFTVLFSVLLVPRSVHPLALSLGSLRSSLVAYASFLSLRPPPTGVK